MINKNSEILLIEDRHLDTLAKPEILIFDLDLTLHDVIAHYDHSVNETLMHFGHRSLSDQEMQIACGDNFTSAKELFTDLLSIKQADDAVEFYINHFLRLINE